MPLFEVETDAHIIITWASDTDAANAVALRLILTQSRH